MNHTPGPWHFTANMYGINNKRVYGVEDKNSPFPEGVANCGFGIGSEANARLIAAAPELLQACQEFVEHIKSLGTDTEKCRYLSMALNCRAGNLIEQAIAKATGEQR